MAGNGMKSAFAKDGTQARKDVATSISVVATLIGMTFVVLRIYTRAFIIRNMGVEDWTMISAATLTIIFLSLFIVGIDKFGVGSHIQWVTAQQAVSGVKMGLATIVIYKSIVTLIKMSILMIYLRIAVSKTFERLCKGTIYLLAGYQIIVIFMVPLQCTPMSKIWNPKTPGRCIDTAVFYYFTSGLHILADIWILLLPYKLILSIPRPLRERLSVYAIFGLGVLSTICAIVRFRYLVAVIESTDPFFDSIPVNVWSVIEVNVGMLCACLPPLRPLFSRGQRERTREALNFGPKDSDGSKKNGKRGAFLHTKEMFITITAGTWRGGDKTMVDDEEGLLSEEFAPPVPPKDEKSSPSPRIAYPDMVHRKP